MFRGIASFVLVVVFAGFSPCGKHCNSLKLQHNSYQFGNITTPWEQRHAFVFTNVGEDPLQIRTVTTPCGCATPIWPRQPIAPGHTDSVVVKVSPRNIYGEFSKTLEIVYNHHDTARITVAGNVELSQRF